MTDLDLGRYGSVILEQVRTVLSRAQTAHGQITPVDDALLVTNAGTRKPGERRTGVEAIPHPERHEIADALAKVIALLEPWAKTGSPKNRGYWEAEHEYKRDMRGLS